MPRRVDPGTIGVGAGLAPEGTVEDNSLRYPERDVDPLRVHVVDPSRAHMAVTIGIDDAGHCYTSDEVEGALQEICAGAGAGRMNGMVAGGFFQELALAGGTPYNPTLPGPNLTLTLVDPTTVLINAHVIELGGATITLPANQISYIYVDCDSSSATYEQMVSKLAPPPPIDAGGVEHVMLAKVSTTGATVDTYQDARFFVADLDRKLAYSSREGENVQSWSESCFVTLDAALFWMEYYHNNGLADQETKTRILIRGRHVIYNTLTVPRHHVVFEGDGEAVIRHAPGSSSTVLFDITDQDNVEFKDLEILSSNAANNSAIFSNSTTKQENIKISRVRFTADGADGWGTPVNLLSSGGGYPNLLIEDCVFSNYLTTGIAGQDVNSGRVRGCTVVALPTAAASTGVQFSPGVGVAADLWFENNNIKANRGFDLGACEEVWIQDNHIDINENGDYGIRFWNPAGTSASDRVHINNNVIISDSTAGSGVLFDTSLNSAPLREHFISGNVIQRHGTLDTAHASPADGWAIAYVPFAGSHAASSVNITGNSFSNWSNTTVHAPLTAGSGGGIYFGSSVEGLVVSGNTIEECPGFLVMHTGSLAAKDVAITDNAGNLATGVPAMGGVILYGEYTRLKVSRNSFHMGGALALAGNTGGAYGVLVETGSDNRSGIFDINENQLLGMMNAAIRVGGYYLQVGIRDNTINGFISSAAPGESPAVGILCGKSLGGSLVAQQVNIAGNNISSCAHGILVEGSSPFSSNGSPENYVITGNTIECCGGAIWTPAFTVPLTDQASMGIGILNAKQVVVSNNSIREMGIQRSLSGVVGITGSDEGTIGVCALNSQQLNITGNQINKMYSKAAGVSVGIRVLITQAGAGAGASTYEWRGYNISDNIIDNDPVTVAVPGDVCRIRGIEVLCINSDDTYNHNLQEVRVANNTISHLMSYAHSGIASTGIYLRAWTTNSATNMAALRDTVVTGNQINTVEGFGIFAESTDYLGVDALSMQLLSISGNTVNRMAETTGVADTAGICVAVAEEANVRGVKIDGNILDKAYNHGIWMHPTGDTTMREVSICNNIIPEVTGALANQGGVGVHLQAAVAGSDRPILTGVQIKDNRIGGDNGDLSQPLWLHTGILLTYPESKMQNIAIAGNDIATNTWGIYWTQQNLGATPATWIALDAQDISIVNNRLWMFRGGNLPYIPSGFWPIQATTRGVAVDRLTIEDNTAFGGRSASPGGGGVGDGGTFSLRHETNTNPISNWSICRNRLISTYNVTDDNGHAIEIEIEHKAAASGGIDIEDIVIENNDCQNGEISFDVDFNGGAGDVDGVSISNNEIRPINDVHAIYCNFTNGVTGNVQVVKNLKVDGNIISSVGDVNPGSLFNVNPFLAITIIGTTSGGQYLTSLQGASISNNNIRGNELVRGCHGIYLDIGGNGVTISDNTLTELGEGDAAAQYFPVGIYLKHTQGNSWKNLNMTGNTITGAGQAGIELWVGSEGGTAGKDQGWNISENTILRCGTRGSGSCSGLKISGSSGTLDLLKNVRVANNLVQVGGNDFDAPGIVLNLDAWSQISQISVVGNQINKVEGQSLGYGIRLLTPDTSTLVNIDGNSVRQNTYEGIRVDAYGAMYNASLCDNNISTNATVKVSISDNGQINFVADALNVLEGCKVDGNLIQGNTVENQSIGGVHIQHDNSSGGAYFTNVSVCTNSIIDTEHGIRLGNRGFLQDYMVDWVGLKVDGNAIHNVQYRGVKGIAWEAGNQIFRNFSVCDNQITHEPTNDFTGVDLVTGGGGDNFLCNFWDVSRNQILFLNPLPDTAQGTVGIYAVCLGQVTQWGFNNNRVRGHGQWGIAVGPGLATTAVREFQFIGNSIESTAGNTATTGSGDISAVGDLVIEGMFGPTAMNVFTIADNSLRNQSKDAGRNGLVLASSLEPGELKFWNITGNSCVNYQATRAVVTDMFNTNFTASVINSNLNTDMAASTDNFDGGLTWSHATNKNIGNVNG